MVARDGARTVVGMVERLPLEIRLVIDLQKDHGFSEADLVAQNLRMQRFKPQPRVAQKIRIQVIIQSPAPTPGGPHMAVGIFFVEPGGNRAKTQEAPFRIDIRTRTHEDAPDSVLGDQLEKRDEIAGRIIRAPIAVFVGRSGEIELALGILVEIPRYIKANGVHLGFDHAIQRFIPKGDHLRFRKIASVAAAQAEILKLGAEQLRLLLPVDAELAVLDLDGSRRIRICVPSRSRD